MTDTLVGVSPPPEPAEAGDAQDRELSPAELAAVQDLVHRARQAGIALTGPDGLLKAMTKTVVEAALEEEIADHLGYDKHAVEGRNRANSRNGTRMGRALEARAERLRRPHASSPGPLRCQPPLTPFLGQSRRRRLVRRCRMAVTTEC